MQALHAAARKYRTDTNQLPQLLIETSERLDALSASQNIEALRSKVKEQASS